MFLRSVTFVVVCAPVWILYASSPVPKSGVAKLPAVSAMAWTGVGGTLCFGGAAVEARVRARQRHCRRIRVRRLRSRGGRVPTVRLVESPDVATAEPGAIDFRLWPRVQRAMAHANDVVGPAAVARPVRRCDTVRFFDGRVTLCGLNGIQLENPHCVIPNAVDSSDAAGPYDSPAGTPSAAGPSLDVARGTG